MVRKCEIFIVQAEQFRFRSDLPSGVEATPKLRCRCREIRIPLCWLHFSVLKERVRHSTDSLACGIALYQSMPCLNSFHIRHKMSMVTTVYAFVGLSISSSLSCYPPQHLCRPGWWMRRHFLREPEQTSALTIREDTPHTYRHTHRKAKAAQERARARTRPPCTETKTEVRRTHTKYAERYQFRLSCTK